MAIDFVNRKIQEAGGNTVAVSPSMEEQQRCNTESEPGLSSPETEQEVHEEGSV